jgi:hypothetical protein
MTSVINDLWEELAAPSAATFLKALRARGIQAREADVREFVSSKSERQVLAPAPKFTGKVNAFYRNDRWAADLINYTNRPATKSGKSYAQVLFVQDLFSRYIYTVPMTTVTETPEAFKTILTEAKPRQIDTDRGVEFKSNAFAVVCKKHNILHILKDTQDVNGLARMDNAIGQLKKTIRRLQEIKGGNWLSHLEKATSAFNKTHHGATDAAPNKMKANVVLEQINAAAEGVEHNMEEIDKRKAKLEKLGGFRVLKDKQRGLRRRIDASIWSKRIYVVTSFPHPATVKDEDGEEHKTKRVMAVPLDSSEQAAAPDTVKDKLRPFAVEMRQIVETRPDTYANIVRAMKKTGLEAALRGAGLSSTDFTDMFSELITRNKRTISATQDEDDAPLTALKR